MNEKLLTMQIVETCDLISTQFETLDTLLREFLRTHKISNENHIVDKLRSSFATIDEHCYTLLDILDAHTL